MNLWWRTLLQALRRTRADCDPFDVVSTYFRVLPTDLDVYGHMNNGRYLSISDLGRLDLLRRTGLWPALRSRGWYPVIASSTITYRRSLQPWQRYAIESRILGVSGRDVYMEQRFAVGGEIFARLLVRGRFLQKSGGHVPMEGMLELLGDPSRASGVPQWLQEWGEHSSLPSSRSPAPSRWD